MNGSIAKEFLTLPSGGDANFAFSHMWVGAVNPGFTLKKWGKNEFSKIRVNIQVYDSNIYMYFASKERVHMLQLILFLLFESSGMESNILVHHKQVI